MFNFLKKRIKDDRFALRITCKDGLPELMILDSREEAERISNKLSKRGDIRFFSIAKI